MAAGHGEGLVPFSKLKMAVATILAQEKFIDSVKEATLASRPYISIGLKYKDPNTPAIKHIARVSRPGRRVYNKKKELPRVLNDYGIAIVSTPQGLMTNKEARKRGLGGEVICEVY